MRTKNKKPPLATKTMKVVVMTRKTTGSTIVQTPCSKMTKTKKEASLEHNGESQSSELSESSDDEDEDDNGICVKDINRNGGIDKNTDARGGST